MTPTTRTALRALAAIETSIGILHDLAAQSPQAAREVVAALQAQGTPAAWDAARQVRAVAEARHGKWRME